MVIVSIYQYLSNHFIGRKGSS